MVALGSPTAQWLAAAHPLWGPGPPPACPARVHLTPWGQCFSCAKFTSSTTPLDLAGRPEARPPRPPVGPTPANRHVLGQQAHPNAKRLTEFRPLPAGRCDVRAMVGVRTVRRCRHTAVAAVRRSAPAFLLREVRRGGGGCGGSGPGVPTVARPQGRPRGAAVPRPLADPIAPVVSCNDRLLGDTGSSRRIPADDLATQFRGSPLGRASRRACRAADSGLGLDSPSPRSHRALSCRTLASSSRR